MECDKSEYFVKLAVEKPDVAARYKDKTRCIDHLDPFAVPSNQMDKDFTSLPPVSSFDVTAYLVLTHSFYTKEQMKAYKSLSAFKYFEAGFVSILGAKIINDLILVLGKVQHSQRIREQSLNVWVLCEKNGSISTGHCTCMAGLSEVCSHIAAVLYTLEYIYKTRTSTSCTDLEAKWVGPSTKKDVPIVKLADLELKVKRKKPNVEPSTSHDSIPVIEGEELVSLLSDCENCGDGAALCRVVEPFASKIEQSMQLPKLKTMYNIYQENYQSSSYNELSVLAGHVDQVLTEEECHKIFDATLHQSSSEWFKQRAGRITASNFKRACRTSVAKPSLSLIKTVCYPKQVCFKTKATQWGQDHEKTALQNYECVNRDNHTNLKLKKCGLFLNPDFPAFGATPDSLVNCDCCGEGCIEVKCPYVLKDNEWGKYLDSRTSCLVIANDDVDVKKDHAYYYQVQLQLKISRLKYCDFVVFSPKSFLRKGST